MNTAVPKPHRIPDLCQMIPAVEGRNHHDQVAARKPRTKKRTKERKKRKEAERRKAQFSCRACKARRASGGTRSPFGVPLRLLPRGLLIPKARPRPELPGTWREPASLWTANRGESRKHLHGRYPRPPVPVQRAPRVPVIVPAGMMPGPPERGSDKPPPAGTAPRSAGRSHPAGVLSVSKVAVHLSVTIKVSIVSCSQ
jgi:hypothetical protein